ncbi:hypothetical protein EV641_111135 [Rhodococcus sp. SMB37]|nr:hypothetical protein EV641_111135 [Rhodococcus sp. SMB37]
MRSETAVFERIDGFGGGRQKEPVMVRLLRGVLTITGRRVPSACGADGTGRPRTGGGGAGRAPGGGSTGAKNTLWEISTSWGTGRSYAFSAVPRK